MVFSHELILRQEAARGQFTSNALIYQHCYAEPDLPRTLNPDISDAYQAVVLKCLQKKPENRYQSAEELIRDLDGILQGNMLASALANYRGGTGAEEAQRENLSWAQRNLVTLMLTLALLLTLGGVGGFFLLQHEAKNVQNVAELARALAMLDSPQPIPRGATQDLERYASLPGADQAKVDRWRDKLKRVDALRQGLSKLEGRPGARGGAADRARGPQALPRPGRRAGARRHRLGQGHRAPAAGGEDDERDHAAC